MAVRAPVGVQTKEQHIVGFCWLPSLAFNQNTAERRTKIPIRKHSVHQWTGRLQFIWNTSVDQMVTEFYLLQFVFSMFTWGHEIAMDIPCSFWDPTWNTLLTESQTGGELKIYCFREHLCIDFCFAFSLSISESDVSSIWLFLFSMPMLPKNQQFPTVLHFRTNEDIIISLSRKKKLCFVGD